MNIAVTGAGGFIGSNMVQFLKRKGHFVRAIIHEHHLLTMDRYSQADQLATIDLRTRVGDLFEGMDWVFHFSANMGGVGYFSENNYQPFIDNMRMDMNVLDGCVRNNVVRMFYPSSACIYPVNLQQKEGEPKLLNENMVFPANADQMYGWEKLMTTMLSRYSPVDMRVGILSTVFGEGQPWTGEKTKFPPAITYKMIDAKRKNAPLEVWGNGKQIRNFQYIEDAMEKIYEVMNSREYFGPVNISSDIPVTIDDVIGWLSEISGYVPKIVYQQDKPSGVISRSVDNSKFYKFYTYREQYTPKEGFRRLYSWIESKYDATSLIGKG